MTRRGVSEKGVLFGRRVFFGRFGVWDAESPDWGNFRRKFSFEKIFSFFLKFLLFSLTSGAAFVKLTLSSGIGTIRRI